MAGKEQAQGGCQSVHSAHDEVLVSQSDRTSKEGSAVLPPNLWWQWETLMGARPVLDGAVAEACNEILSRNFSYLGVSLYLDS